MKKILLIVGICFAAFLAGSLGIYYSMPVLNPEHARQSAGLTDSLMEYTVADSIPLPAHVHDSAVARLALDSMLTMDADSVAQGRSDVVPLVVAMLRDSLATLTATLDQVTADAARLRAEIASMATTAPPAVAEAEPAAAQLSQTLSKLDDKELRPILRNLRISTLEVLYDQASTRDRRRLVASMPTEKAAQLVARQVHGSTASIESDQATESPEVPN